MSSGLVSRTIKTRHRGEKAVGIAFHPLSERKIFYEVDRLNGTF